MSDLAGRTALVTGAGSGIGRATAVVLAAAGARVVVQDVAPERVAEVVSMIAAAGGKAVGAVYSVADEERLRESVWTFSSTTRACPDTTP
jgi:NAD(P)-dependent dehydrogenase (short-subunit alcohol dehydrogenase family)